MATRTKSFFDQDHSRTPKPGQWSRRESAGRVALSEKPENLNSKPPIPATSQAKTKLSAFQFVAGENGSETSQQQPGDVDTNTEDRGENQDERSRDTASNKDPQHSSSVVVPSLPHANSFPCTPGARLPLEDLIGDCDQSKEAEPSNESPEEQIGWIPNSSSDLLTPNRKRKRKRARSSSPSNPCSSSQANRSAATSTQSALKTPAADPAGDLWRQYANGRQASGTAKLPEINSLIFQGSPRSIETPLKDGKLRRWASTGNDWPSTKNKRRCTNSRTSIDVWQDQPVAEAGGKSKVASMVQRMQESLALQRLEQEQHETPAAKSAAEAPSSSSPLPDVGAGTFAMAQSVSPLQTRKTQVEQRGAEQAPRPQVQRTQSGGMRIDPARQGGDPLAPGAAPTYVLQSKAPLPAYKRPSIRPPSQPKVQSIAPPPATKSDDFDDDDFNLTADDLDELCTQIPLEQETLRQVLPHPTPPPPQLHRAPANAIPELCPPTILLDDDDDDEFGDNDIDEDSFTQAEFSATQSMRVFPRKQSPRQCRSPRKVQKGLSASSERDIQPSRFKRYVVKQVLDGTYTNDSGCPCPEKVLRAEAQTATRTTMVTLRESWLDSPVFPGAIVHISPIRQCKLSARESSRVPPPGQIIISDDKNSPLLIIHPDHMLSATTVADSFDCARKAVLQDRIKATGETSKPMVYGKILHEVFQQALSANIWDERSLNELVERAVQAHVEDLWELGMRDNNLAIEEVRAKMGEITAWAQVFVRSEPGAAAQVDDKQGEKVLMSISKLIAIEEHIWSPQYGLKGNVDATIQSTLVSRPGAPDLRNLVVPFEVKTGRTTQSPAHRAQTALYTLLLSDRYDVAVEAGILYYLESSSMFRIAPPLNEIRQMVQQRNRVAAFTFHARNPTPPDQPVQDVVFMQSQAIQEYGLPSLLKNPFKCGRCYAQQSCFTFHALVENGNADTAGMTDDNRKNHSTIWTEAMGHLALDNKDTRSTDALRQWFSKWDRLLTFEEGDQCRFRKELWTMSSAEREAAGRCFGKMVLTKDMTSTSTATQTTEDAEGGGGKINRYAYSFSRASGVLRGNFTEGSQLTVGEPVVVSSEQGQWALANGYVIAVKKDEVTVAVDRKLGDSRQREADFDDKTNQAFHGTMVVGGRQHRDSDRDAGEETLYRLDKDEFANGLALIRNNLVSLMSSNPITTKLREQLVFGAEPTFTPTPSIHDQLAPSQIGTMNEDQLAAVSKVLSANDYTLILGMPGTGKTTTIAHVIRALLAQEKTILLTSFTHTAVDNILLKIRDIAPPNSILRLGVPAKINSQVQEFCQLASTPRNTIDEVETAFMGTRIVATTCMGTNHALFNRRSFDVCIVDEASQITLPTILGPLLHARKFVLVGDHFQLPPLVQNKFALGGGLDVSLFRHLSESQPHAVAELGRQYRMCDEIMSLSNELIYHGKLRCGSESVAKRTLQVHDASSLAPFHSIHSSCPTVSSACWLARSTHPQNKVLFANTDGLGNCALETLNGGGKIANSLEATLAAQLILSLLARGVAAAEIGVITLYRSQLALVRQLFRRAGVSDLVEIDSADRYQGRDKEVIVLSMVRNNNDGIVGELLKDWRRVNVALTRARSKLVILGSKKTLRRNELLGKMLEMVDQRGWGVELQEGADAAHCFDFSTQIASALTATSLQASSIKEKMSKKHGKSPPCSGQSPSKRRSPGKISSPSKRTMPLQDISSNQSTPRRSPRRKNSPHVTKVIKGGNEGSLWTTRTKKAKAAVAAEVWEGFGKDFETEDLTGEEF